MGAIAISKREEQQIDRLRKALSIPTKSALIRVALKTLEDKTSQERLRQDIHESVRRCATFDRAENDALVQAGVARRTSAV